jgi:hypothetical protein
MSHRINWLLSVLLLFTVKQSFAQESAPLKFYEIIKDDSVMMFFNERNRFIEKECADFIRYIKIDSGGNFNGYFQDISKENVLLGSGHYLHGEKHGYFEVHYSSGKLKSKGNYKNNIPTGQWDYFYDNELPERTVNITNTDTLLVRFVDSKGNIKVNEGKGDFNGQITGNGSSNLIIAKGKIENGKPNGKWSSVLPNGEVFSKEEFNNGKLIHGFFPNARPGLKKDYYDRAYLNTFMLVDYIGLLEQFKVERCADSARYVQKERLDLQKLSSDLRYRIRDIIENDFKSGNGSKYAFGDNYFSIRFSVNKEGKAEDFSLFSGWNRDLFVAIANSIRLQAKFPGAEEKLFLHLRIHLTGGNTYSTQFHFSRSSSFQ